MSAGWLWEIFETFSFGTKLRVLSDERGENQKSITPTAINFERTFYDKNPLLQFTSVDLKLLSKIAASAAKSLSVFSVGPGPAGRPPFSAKLRIFALINQVSLSSAREPQTTQMEPPLPPGAPRTQIGASSCVEHGRRYPVTFERTLPVGTPAFGILRGLWRREKMQTSRAS